MVAAMAGFALEDVLIKQMTAGMPVGQVLAMLGAVNGLAFSLLAIAQGGSLLSPAVLSRPVVLRNLGEAIGSVAFVSALALSSLSGTSAILQATPLAMTLGAALFLRESVGWRRWTAITLGFAGVLLIIRPGATGFSLASMLAVLCVFALAMRDLASRAVPTSVSSMQLAAWGLLSTVPAGLATLLVTGQAPVVPAASDIARLGGILVVGGLGYYALVAASRTGEVSAVVPFRYTRLVFALLLGAVFFGERPDLPMLAGAALIVGTGLYTIWRTAVRRG